MSTVSRFLLLLLLSLSVEGFFFVIPKNTNVIVGRTLFLECGTYNDGYTLDFEIVAPPGYSVSSKIVREDLSGGGKKISATFIVTKELNTTTVRCSAIGSTYEQTNRAVIYAYELPDGVKNFRVFQLGNYTFLNWDPIYALEGIKLTYNITDNMGSNNVTSDLHHSFPYTKENYFAYNANVTVIVNATAANQIGYSIPTIISRILNGTIPLTVEYSCDNDGGNWKFDFCTKLDHLHINDCFINNETLKDAMIISCNEEEQCENNLGSVKIMKNEINSTDSLPAKRKYNHTLCFNFLGREIKSQPLLTSTHDVQDIEYLSQNDTSLCLRFHLIDHYKIESIHIHVERERSEPLQFNVTIPNKSTLANNNYTFEWCASTIQATSSSNNGNWSLSACDGPAHICNNPAVVLENIMLNIKTATTHNTISTTYTSHTTTTSSSYSTSVVSSLSLSPSSTVLATLPSSTVNWKVLLAVVAVVIIFTVVAVAVAVILLSVLIRVKNKTKKPSKDKCVKA